MACVHARMSKRLRVRARIRSLRRGAAAAAARGQQQVPPRSRRCCATQRTRARGSGAVKTSIERAGKSGQERMCVCGVCGVWRVVCRVRIYTLAPRRRRRHHQIYHRHHQIYQQSPPPSSSSSSSPARRVLDDQRPAARVARHDRAVRACLDLMAAKNIPSAELGFRPLAAEEILRERR